MSIEWLFWLTNVAWFSLGLGCAVWGGNAVIVAYVRTRLGLEPLFGSWNPWRWTWATTHGLKDIAFAVVAFHVTVVRLNNEPGAADSVAILTVRLVAAALLWLCILRWSFSQYGTLTRQARDSRRTTGEGVRA